MSAHKFKPETTNGGHCFSDCSCGWAGGVYPTRPDARLAWIAHRDEMLVPEHVRPTFLAGPRARGMCGDES